MMLCCLLIAFVLPIVSTISPPSQVSLAAGSAADSEVAFAWLTDDPRDDDESCNSVAVVELIGKVVSVAASECRRYTYGSTFGNYTSGRIHHVRIRNLTPDTEYRYRLAGDPSSVERSFRTLPASSSRGSSSAIYPIRFGTVGDLGQTNNSVQTVRHLDNDPDIRLILHAGDMAYADSDATHWDSYGEKVEPLSSRTQWMVCPGNHEIESDRFTGRNFVPYEARFAMPSLKPARNVPSPSQIGCEHPWPPRDHPGPDCTPSIFQANYDWGNSFYAFTAGPARIISLNSYTDSSPGSPQHSWLKAELASLGTKRAETPWLIVQMHCPFYNSNKAHYEEKQAVEMRDANGFEDLFFENNVSVVLSGHVHAYERSFPVYRQSLNVRGPTYIVLGDGGNREGHASKYRIAPRWSANRNGLEFGSGALTLLNETHMHWEWIINDPSSAMEMSRHKAEDVADKHARAGALSTDESASFWRQPLPGRVVADAAWIINPWKALDVQEIVV